MLFCAYWTSPFRFGLAWKTKQPQKWSLDNLGKANKQREVLLEWLLENLDNLRSRMYGYHKRPNPGRKLKKFLFPSLTWISLWVSVYTFFHPGNQLFVLFSLYIGMWQVMVTKFMYPQFQTSRERFTLLSLFWFYNLMQGLSGSYWEDINHQ